MWTENKWHEFFVNSSSSSSYFESSSEEEDLKQNSQSLSNEQQSSPRSDIFINAADPLLANAQGLCRHEMGGIVVYESQARIIGNPKHEQYYEANLPKKANPNLLFSKEHLQSVNELFDHEPRERDFQNDFEKFVFKHLPKLKAQRDQPSPQYTITVPQQDNSLIFDSRFESGNLRRAVKVNNVEYNLWLENDVNTKGHIQWYFFKVVYSYPQKQRIQFNILNFMKTQSLYTSGMKPCVYSKKQHELKGTTWFRGCEDIKYYQNEIARNKAGNEGVSCRNQFLQNKNGAGEGVEYNQTLTFSYEFEHEEDEVYFAYAVPYTFTDLQQYIIDAQKITSSKSILKSNVLALALSGAPCPLLTVTENVGTYLDYYDELKIQQKLPNLLKKQVKQKYQKAKKLYKQSVESRGKVRKLLTAAFEEEINSFYEFNEETFKACDPCFDKFNNKLKFFIQDHFHKKAIIITSRVHPGEPQSSHMLQGLLEYLLSDEAQELRQNFVFRIVPMLNVDGVVLGNYRCSLLGVDLNRKWLSPNKFLHPTVFYAKQLVKQMHNERRVLLYCDMHGHSRKQNAFFYGCTYKNYEHEGRMKNAQLRIIPLLCSHRNFIFSFKDCSFRIEKAKESTARVVVFREFNIMNSFTLECSFYGRETTNEESQTTAVQHITTQECMSLGRDLMKTLENFLPTQQHKLDVLSGKILDIFYDEFIKFIPQYILRREEEKKKQQLELEQQQTPSPLKQSKTNNVGPSSNRKLKKLTVSQISDNQMSQPLKKIAGKRRGTNSCNNKDVLEQYDDSSKQQTINQQQQSSDPEQDNNFSGKVQQLSIQYEFVDLQTFIKKQSEQVQVIEDRKVKKKLAKQGQQTSSGLLDEEEDNCQDSDSSESESEVIHIFKKHQQEQNKQQDSKSKKGKKSLKKNLQFSKKELNRNSTKQQYQGLPGVSILQGQRIASSTQLENPAQNKDDLIRQRQRAEAITQKEKDLIPTATAQLNTAKEDSPKIISNKELTSPDQEKAHQAISHDSLESNKLEKTQSIGSSTVNSQDKALSRNLNLTPFQTSELQQSEDEKQKELLKAFLFQSYDDHRHQKPKRQMIPLYEHPQYHHDRLLLSNSDFQNNISEIPKKGFNVLYDPYENNRTMIERKSSISSKSNKRDSSATKLPLHLNNTRDQQIFKHSPYTLVNQYDSQKSQYIGKNRDQSNLRSRGKLTNLKACHHYGQQAASFNYYAQQQPKNHNFSVQRVSFKHLLETSRLRAPSQDPNTTSTTNIEQQTILSTAHLLSMLKTTQQPNHPQTLSHSNLPQEKATNSSSYRGQRQQTAHTGYNKPEKVNPSRRSALGSRRGQIAEIKPNIMIVNSNRQQQSLRELEQSFFKQAQPQTLPQEKRNAIFYINNTLQQVNSNKNLGYDLSQTRTNVQDKQGRISNCTSKISQKSSKNKKMKGLFQQVSHSIPKADSTIDDKKLAKVNEDSRERVLLPAEKGPNLKLLKNNSEVNNQKSSFKYRRALISSGGHKRMQKKDKSTESFAPDPTIGISSR